jgi:serine protease Do
MKILKSNWSILALALGAVIFGMVLAGLLDIDGRTHAGQTAEKYSAAPAPAPEALPSAAGAPDFVSINRRISPAVVAITSTKVVKQRGRSMGGQDDFFHFFFGPNGPGQGGGEDGEDGERKQRSGGSGFIISPDGYIVTNHHVVEDADEVEVTISDEHKVKAKVVGKDPATDLALLKVDDGRDLPYVTLGDSGRVEIGEWVLAIGYPLIYGKTATSGIISATGRKIGISQATSSFENFLQTDAAINFGNSGGPLVNMRGEVIGVNTAISVQGQNIGFAVPINQFKDIRAQLQEKGKVVRGYMGVKIRDVDEEIAKAFGLSEPKGALVESVESDSPAEKAGLKHGDIIVKVDAVTVAKTGDLIQYVSSKAPGAKVKVTVIRKEKPQEFTITLTQRNAEGEGEEAGEEEKPSSKGVAQEKLGLSVDEISDQSRRYYRLEDDVRGLLVVGVKRVSKAADAGIREGDVLLEANGEELTKPSKLDAMVGDLNKGGYLRLYVLRPGARGASFYALIPMD